MATQIRHGLFLGSQLDVEKISPEEVSHILTVCEYSLPAHIKAKFICKEACVEDEPAADLLSKLEELALFIEEAINVKGCLVHCIAGVSRSTTVVAGYIMWKEKMSSDLVLETIKKCRPQICPNNGFLFQLKLFEKMGFHLDNAHPEYKLYKLTGFANSVRRNLKSIRLEDLTIDPQSDQKCCIVFKCKKCRRTLFRQDSLIEHAIGVGEAAFDWRAATEVSNSHEICSKSLFIEPIQWMHESIRILEGKISCPKCSSKLGSFNWSGECCPCGRWVTPAFHIGTGKVDKVVPFPTLTHPID